MLNLSKQFQQYVNDKKIVTALAIGINEGEMNVFRSFIFGEDINEASSCADVASHYRRHELKTNFILKAREGLEKFGKISEVKTPDFSEGIQDGFSKFLSENKLVRIGVEDEIP